jgi:hypothetical protein
MSVLRVRCVSCRRTWLIAGPISVYFQLDLVSHPCPHCEAYALSCEDASVRSRSGRHPAAGEARARAPRHISAARDRSG